MGTTCSKDYNKGVNKRRRQKLGKYEMEKRSLPPQQQSVVSDGTPFNRSLGSIGPTNSNRSASPRTFEFRSTPPRSRGSSRPMTVERAPQPQRRPQNVQMINILLSQEIEDRTRLNHEQARIWLELRFNVERELTFVRAAIELGQLETQSRGSVIAAERKHYLAILNFFAEDAVDTSLSVMVTERSHTSVSRNREMAHQERLLLLEENNHQQQPQRNYNKDFDWSVNSRITTTEHPKPLSTNITPSRAERAKPNVLPSRTPTRVAPQPPQQEAETRRFGEIERNNLDRRSDAHSQRMRRMIQEEAGRLERHETVKRNSILYEESTRMKSIAQSATIQPTVFGGVYGEDALTAKMERQRRLISESRRSYGSLQGTPNRAAPQAPNGMQSRFLENVSQVSAQQPSESDRSLRDASTIAFQQRLQALSGAKR